MSEETLNVPVDLQEDDLVAGYYDDAPSSAASGDTGTNETPETASSGETENGETGKPEDASEEVETHFPNLGAFVEWLVEAWDHKIDGHEWAWCPQWWKHGEAFARLSALWRSWEEMRQTPSGLSEWWVDHLDRHMSILLSSTGPFRHCWEEGHEAGMEALRNESPRFRVEEAPADLWAPVERS